MMKKVTPFGLTHPDSSLNTGFSYFSYFTGVTYFSYFAAKRLQMVRGYSGLEFRV
jgi:hypothetical protein